MKRQALILWILICGLVAQKLEGAILDVLDKVSMRAFMSQSDAVLITYRGHPIYSYGDEKLYEPIETRSITKSIVCLAIGMLMQESKICSLNTPVYHYFPEWNQGLKKYITLYHLLSNTSGLALDEGTEVYDTPDCIKLALASDMASVPGTRFIYNNKAINLLAKIVEKASGETIHDYVKSHLFYPLGIKTDTWLCDTAGNHYGMAHMTMSALDLAKIGAVVINGGCWNGRQLLAKEWIDTFARPSQNFNPFYGLLWWLDYNRLCIWWDDSLIELYAFEGIDPSHIEALKKLNGQLFPLQGMISYGNFYERCASHLSEAFGGEMTVYRFIADLEGKGLPLCRWDQGEINSFSARGYLGQQMLIKSQDGLIAVRLARSCGQLNSKFDTFTDFEGLVQELGQEVRLAPKSIEYIRL